MKKSTLKQGLTGINFFGNMNKEMSNEHDERRNLFFTTRLGQQYK